MKVLLASIDSKYIHSNLAIRSIKLYAEKKFGLLKQAGNAEVSIDTAEYTINQPIQKIISGIYKHDADIIMLSCYIWNRVFMERLLRDLAVVSPDVEVWLGGPEVSFDSEQILKDFTNVRGVMLGEGEETCAEILKAYIEADTAKSTASENDTKMHLVHLEKEAMKISGIVFRSETGEIVCTPQRAPLDMDELPFAYENIKEFENKIIYYESSRGCLFRCSYCLSSVDKKLRFRSLDMVKKELKFFLDNNVPQVKFVDRTFNCDHDRTMKIWRFLKENDNGITNFHFEMAADILREEEIELLSSLRCGQVQLEIGVQTTNSRTLAAIERPMDFEKLCSNVSALKKAGNVHLHLDLIAGLPHEDMESFRKSFDDVFSLRPEQLQLGFLKVLKGSPMADRCGAYGLKYTAEPPYEVLETKWISYDELLALKQVEEMVEVYYNSGQFMNTLELLIESFDSAFDMFEALGRWYEQKELDMLNLSRNSRYEKLMEFTGEVLTSREALKDAIIFDYYLRENVKTRPAFLGEETVDKSFAKEFYSLESRDHRYLTGVELAEVSDPRILRKHTHLERTANGYLLFDYTRRDALTNNAKVVEI